VVLKQNQVQRGAHRAAIEASAVFGDPPKVTFGPPAEAHDARR
jgi:hypothetical protein